MRLTHLLAILAFALLTVAGLAVAKIDSEHLAAGASFPYKFEHTGTFDYVCLYHPGMVGTVTIQEGAATTPVTIGMGPGGDGYVFLPDAVTIGPGTTVTWNNNDTVPHTATETAAKFDKPAKEGPAVGIIALLVAGLALVAIQRRR